MNTINLIGRITNDLELKQTTSGKTKCEFTLAVNRNGGKEDKTTDFIKCDIWGKQAENLQLYQKKGNQIAVTGSLRVDTYKDKEDKTRTMTYVLVNDVFYLEKKADNTKEEKAEKPNGWVSAKDIEISPQELPFY